MTGPESPPPQFRPPAARPGWINGCLLLFGLGLLFGLILLLASSFVGGSARHSTVLAPALPFGHRVGVITLEGEIADAQDFEDELDRLQDDPRVKALVLRINSPGGEVVATQEIHHALQRFHEKTGDPIVASLGSLAASGGYYAAVSAQRIMAEPGTVTGSIGVIFDFADASDLLKKVGIRFEVVKSGAKKDFGAYWRPLTDEERAMLQGIVQDVYDQFTEAVAQGRSLPVERVRELADGRVLSGRQALQAGLVDTLGFQEDAVRLAARMAGLPPDTPTLSKRWPVPPFYDLIRRLGGEVAGLVSFSPRLLYR